ncbi:unnamed protein product [Ectocarpus sp. 12 AP-2014]
MIAPNTTPMVVCQVLPKRYTYFDETMGPPGRKFAARARRSKQVGNANRDGVKFSPTTTFQRLLPAGPVHHSCSRSSLNLRAWYNHLRKSLPLAGRADAGEKINMTWGIRRRRHEKKSI